MQPGSCSCRHASLAMKDYISSALSAIINLFSHKLMQGCAKTSGKGHTAMFKATKTLCYPAIVFTFLQNKDDVLQWRCFPCIVTQWQQKVLCSLSLNSLTLQNFQNVGAWSLEAQIKLLFAQCLWTFIANISLPSCTWWANRLIREMPPRETCSKVKNTALDVVDNQPEVGQAGSRQMKSPRESFHASDSIT